MFSSFSEVDLPALTRMMRRTMLMALVVGAGAVVVAFMLAPPLAGVGIAVGVGLAILNLRAMDAGVAKVETKGTTNNKVLRRLLGTRTATRLAVITAVAIGLLLLSPPLGIGVVIGLVLFQLVFVLNVARAITGGGPAVIHMLAVNIPVGEHASVVKLGPLTFDLDTIWSSLVAMAVVLALGFFVRAKATSGVPGKVQLAWEALVEQIQDISDSAIGPEGRQIVPLAICIFVFILVCNWIGFIPARLGHDWLPPATSDVSLPLAMALVVWLWSNAKSIRIKGIGGYGKHFFQPYAFLAPINVIEELTKPVTLTFRLFGNVFAGALMVVVLASFGWPITIIGEILWKPFDLFIGLIQAFIFALLTIMYFGMAMSKEGH